MRNVVTVILPPNREMTFEVKPPMRLTERPIVLTIRKEGIVINQLSSSEVLVQNPTNLVMPILFFVVESGTLSLIGALKQLIAGPKETP